MPLNEKTVPVIRLGQHIHNYTYDYAAHKWVCDCGKVLP